MEIVESAAVVPIDFYSNVRCSRDHWNARIGRYNEGSPLQDVQVSVNAKSAHLNEQGLKTLNGLMKLELEAGIAGEQQNLYPYRMQSGR